MRASPNPKSYRRLLPACLRSVVLPVALLSAAGAALGQGIVNFFNNPKTLVSGTDGSPITGAGKYFFALLAAPVGTTDPHLFTFTGAYATNMAVPGRINGGGGWGQAVRDWVPGASKT